MAGYTVCDFNNPILSSHQATLYGNKFNKLGDDMKFAVCRLHDENAA